MKYTRGVRCLLWHCIEMYLLESNIIESGYWWKTCGKFFGYFYISFRPAREPKTLQIVEIWSIMGNIFLKRFRYWQVLLQILRKNENTNVLNL